jgi:hypothetical protein
MLVAHFPERLCELAEKVRSALGGDAAAQAAITPATVAEGLQVVSVAGCDFTAEQLASTSPADRLLICFALHDRLPLFLPSATVSFSTCLGAPACKHVLLTNPTKRPVSYALAVEDNPGTRSGTFVVAPAIPLPLSEAAKDSGAGAAAGSVGGASGKGSTSADALQVGDDGLPVFPAPTPDESGTYGSSSGVISIPPHRSVVVPVVCVPAFARPAGARLVLTPAARDDSKAAPLVFSLVAEVSGGAPLSVSSLTAACYSSATQDVLVRNPFDRTVALVLETAQTPPSPPSVPGFPSSYVPAIAFAVHPSYSSAARPLRLAPGETATIRVLFSPLHPGIHTCLLRFVDPDVGEFSLQINGSALAPDPIDSIRLTGEAGVPVERVLSLAPRNSLLDKLRVGAPHPPPPPGVVIVPRSAGLSQIQRVFKEQRPVVYHVSYLSPIVTGPPTVRLDKESARLPLVFQSGTAAGSPQEGTFETAIILHSEYDHRVIKLQAVMHARPQQISLELEAAPGEVVVQSIPVFNPAKSEARVSVTLEVSAEALPDASQPLGENGEPVLIPLTGAEDGYFSCPMELRVPGEGTLSLPLTFSPLWVSRVSGTLTLRNHATNLRSTVTLSAVCVEPTASSHQDVEVVARAPYAGKLLVTVPVTPADPLLQAWAKSHTAEPFPVPTAGEVTLDVHCDLPVVSGPAEVTLRVGDTVEWPFTVETARSGTARGVVSFYLRGCPFRPYLWHALDVSASEPEFEDEIEMSTVCRQAIAASVDVHNPLDETVRFFVEVVGDGLLGEPTLVLGPRESGTYQLVFSPLLPSSGVGSVTFRSDSAGDFWYRVVTTASPAPVESVAPFAASVGASHSRTVEIENPLSESITLSATVTNGANFSVTPSLPTTLAGLGTLQLTVTFRPASICRKESGTLTVTSSLAGTWCFDLVGEGAPPEPAPLTRISAPLNAAASGLIAFRNPFTRPVKADIHVELDDASMPWLASSSLPSDEDSWRALREELSSAFSLVLKRTSGVSIEPNTSLQIPVSFRALSLNEVRAKVVVEVAVEGVDGLSADNPVTPSNGRRAAIGLGGPMAALGSAAPLGMLSARTGGPGNILTQRMGGVAMTPSSQRLSGLGGVTLRAPVGLGKRAVVGLSHGSVPGSPTGSVASRAPTGSVFADSAMMSMRRGMDSALSRKTVSGRRASVSFGQQGALSLNAGRVSSLRPPSARRPKLRWSFPLSGLPEVPPPDAAIKISTDARTSVSREIPLVMAGLPRGQFGASETLEVSLQIEPSSAFEAQLMQAVTLRRVTFTPPLPPFRPPIGAAIPGLPVISKDEPDTVLPLAVTFKPLRVMSGHAQILVQRKPSGGRWLFDLALDALPPSEFDGRVVVESHPGVAGREAVLMRNVFATYAPFKAYFTAASSAELRVEPTSGVLAPVNAPQGTEVVVVYAPGSYGQPRSGVLVVETDQVQWRFDVRGTYAPYQPPTGVARVESLRPADAKVSRMIRTKRPSSVIRE